MHLCHWEGCHRTVPDTLYCCAIHWFRIPRELRNELWRTYRLGTHTAEYIEAHHQIQLWIKGNHG
jgi:hypothetical protein